AVGVCEATGRQAVAVVHGHTGSVTELAFAPGGLRLASLSSKPRPGWTGDDTARVWDVDPRATLPVLRGHANYVYPVAFSPDGRWIASGDWDGKVLLWDAATGERCATLPHAGVVRAVAFGPDGRWLVTAGDKDDRLHVWDVVAARAPKEIRGPGAFVRHVAVRPDGARVAASAWDYAHAGPKLGVYDVTSCKELFEAVGSVLAYSPDGRWLAVG